MQLSPHFTLAELSFSQTAQSSGIDNRPGPSETEHLRALCLAVLEPLREALGRSIKVNSGYRGPALNKRIGGATKSQHLAGEAADIQAPGLPVVELFQAAIRLALPFDQIIYEANGASKWVHVSHRPGANRGQILVADFGPDGKVRGYPAVSVEQALAMSEPRARSRSRAAAEDGYTELPDEPAADSGHALPAPAPAPAQAPAPATEAEAEAPAASSPSTRTARRPPRSAARVPTDDARKPATRRVAPKKPPAAAKKAAARKKPSGTPRARGS